MSQPNPKREFALEVVRRLKSAGYQALWAGGCVRDLLLGRDAQDYDVATDARPDEVRRLFGYRRTLAVGASFGVIIVRGPKLSGQPAAVRPEVEVATFRTEGPYLDGRRPQHVAFSSPEEDARRRDFTINGIFYDPLQQQVLDYVGGEQDVSAGVVRAIGNPHDRMREDKLRMLRAVRFAATLDFELDGRTADAIRRMAGQIHVVSAERIAQELRKMLADVNRMRAMQLARGVGLLSVILPELRPLLDDEPPSQVWQTTLHMLQLLPDAGFEPAAAGFELAAAVLLHAVPTAGGILPQDKTTTSGADGVRQICRRLRLSNHETDHICWLVSHQHALKNAPNLPLAKLKRLLAHPRIDDLLALFRVGVLAANSDLAPVVFCEQFLLATPAGEINPPPLLTGDDLISRGLDPGPHFKTVLETVRDAQLNNKIHTQAEAFALADRLQDEAGDDKKGPG